MINVVCDTGPLTHLWQIQGWIAFNTFDTIHLSTQVIQEVQHYVTLEQLETISGSQVCVHSVPPALREETRKHLPSHFTLQLADLEILTLAQQLKPDWVLVDDLALRQALEWLGLTPMGSVGILLRAYQTGLLTKEKLDQAIDKLFVHSTLYLSPQFKSYVRNVIATKVRQNGPKAHSVLTDRERLEQRCQEPSRPLTEYLASRKSFLL
jgi:predicted nucleic acid-binding protein